MEKVIPIIKQSDIHTSQILIHVGYSLLTTSKDGFLASSISDLRTSFIPRESSTIAHHIGVIKNIKSKMASTDSTYHEQMQLEVYYHMHLIRRNIDMMILGILNGNKDTNTFSELVTKPLFGDISFENAESLFRIDILNALYPKSHLNVMVMERCYENTVIQRKALSAMILEKDTDVEHMEPLVHRKQSMLSLIVMMLYRRSLKMEKGVMHVCNELLCNLYTVLCLTFVNYERSDQTRSKRELSDTILKSDDSKRQLLISTYGHWISNSGLYKSKGMFKTLKKIVSSKKESPQLIFYAKESSKSSCSPDTLRSVIAKNINSSPLGPYLPCPLPSVITFDSDSTQTTRVFSNGHEDPAYSTVREATVWVIELLDRILSTRDGSDIHNLFTKERMPIPTLIHESEMSDSIRPALKLKSILRESDLVKQIVENGLKHYTKHDFVFYMFKCIDRVISLLSSDSEIERIVDELGGDPDSALDIISKMTNDGLLHHGNLGADGGFNAISNYVSSNLISRE